MALEIIHEGEIGTFETILKDENDVVIPQSSLTALSLVYKNKETADDLFVRIGDTVSDKIDCGADTSLRIEGDITIEARIKMKDPLFPDPLTNYVIAGNENLSTNGYLFRVDSVGGKLMYRTSQAGANQFSRSAVGLLKDRWYHVAVTRTGNTAKFYIDGVLVANELSGVHLDPVPSTTNFIIGQLFDGIIESLRVYNRVLTDAEILERYEKATDIQIGLISEWKFAGDYKDSKASNHGTPTGALTIKNFGIINGRYNQDVRGGGAGQNNHTIGLTDGKLTWTMQQADTIILNPDLAKGDVENHSAEYTWKTATRTGKHVVEIHIRKPLI